MCAYTEEIQCTPYATEVNRRLLSSHNFQYYAVILMRLSSEIKHAIISSYIFKMIFVSSSEFFYLKIITNSMFFLFSFICRTFRMSLVRTIMNTTFRQKQNGEISAV